MVESLGVRGLDPTIMARRIREKLKGLPPAISLEDARVAWDEGWEDYVQGEKEEERRGVRRVGGATIVGDPSNFGCFMRTKGTI